MLKGEQIASGNEKKVHAHATRPGDVVAEYRVRYTPEEMKSAYALGRLAELLFPGQVIHLRGAGNTAAGESTLVSRRVAHDPAHAKLQDVLVAFDKREELGQEVPFSEAEINAAFSNVYDKSDERALSPQVIDFVRRANDAGFQFDTNGQNYTFHDDGSFTYMDLGPAFIYRRDEGGTLTDRVNVNFDPTKLQTAIRSLEPDKRALAEKYFDDLTKLLKNAGVNIQ